MGCTIKNSIGFQIKKTKGIMDREHNKYLKPYGVSSDQGLIMKYVYDMPGCSQTELSEATYKDKTTITRMIDTLVNKGFIKRCDAPSDRRSFCLHLTPKGTEVVETLSPLFQNHKDALEKLIVPEDAEATMRVLKIIEEYFKGLN